MFDEVIFKANLASKIAPGFLVVARFGAQRIKSLVAISQALDKLIVHESSLDSKLTSRDAQSSITIRPFDESQEQEDYNFYTYGTTSRSASNEIASFYYISIRDIIKSLACCCVHENNYENDILLIGCVNSVIIYDPVTQSKRINVNTSGPVELIAISVRQRRDYDRDQINDHEAVAANGDDNDELTVCYGKQKLYLIRLGTEKSDFLNDKYNGEISDEDGGSNGDHHVDDNHENFAKTNDNSKRSKKSLDTSESSVLIGELTSERSTSDDVTCLIQGYFNTQASLLDAYDDSIEVEAVLNSFEQLVVTGSRESQIRLWPIDNFDQNLQNCRVAIEESGPISCLYPINTSTSTSTRNANFRMSTIDETGGNNANGGPLEARLVDGQKNVAELMNHFAFGLENNFVGVYRLYVSSNKDQPQRDSLDLLSYSTSKSTGNRIVANNNNNNNLIYHERLWRLKTRHKPTQMIMYDLNGDGQDELIIGFKNGRLEARSPFTGQLLGATRSFRSPSDHLAGLTTTSYSQASSERVILVALSTRGNLIAYKPRHFRPRQPLQGYMGGDMHSAIAMNDENNTFDEFSELMIKQDHESTSSPQLLSKICLDTTTLGDAELEKHIETRQNDLRPKLVESRQNMEQLHKLNSLHKQLSELQAESSDLLMQRLGQEARLLHQFDVAIQHRWEIDYSELAIKLTIMFSSEGEKVQMVEIIDEKKNFFSSGACLLYGQVNQTKESTATTSVDKYAARLETIDQHQAAAAAATIDSKLNSVISSVSILLRPKRNEPSELLIRVHCITKSQLAKQSSRSRLQPLKSSRMSRVFTKLIKLERFSMFILVPASLKRSIFAQANATNLSRAPNTIISNDYGSLADDQSSFPSEMPIKLEYSIKDATSESSSSVASKLSEWADNNFACFHYVNTNYASFNGDRQQQALEDDEGYHYYEDNVDGGDSYELELTFLDMRNFLEQKQRLSLATIGTVESLRDFLKNLPSTYKDFNHHLLRRNFVRIAISETRLELETFEPDLMLELVQSLGDELANSHNLVACQINSLESKLEGVVENEHQLEQSERRTQSELYESADYTKQLVQQLACAIELDEFCTSRDLLNEASILLDGAQNAAQAHKLNSDTRLKLSQEIASLKNKIAILRGEKRINNND